MFELPKSGECVSCCSEAHNSLGAKAPEPRIDLAGSAKVRPSLADVLPLRAMNDFAAALYKAFALIGGLDAELLEIVVLSLSVSLSGSFCAFLIGAQEPAVLS